MKGRLLLYCLIALSNFAFSQNSKLVEDHFKALNAHDVKTIVTGYTVDAKMFSPNWEGEKAGQTGINEVYTRYFSSTPDLIYKVINVINANKNVIVEYIVSGTLSKPESGTPDYMKDKKYSLNYCAIFTIENDKIVKETDYFDQVAFLRQVGFFDQK